MTTTSARTPDGFIGCDWGSSRLRIRVIRLGATPADFHCLADDLRGPGMLELRRAAGPQAGPGERRDALFARALDEALGRAAAALPEGRAPATWPVVISGMAGASGGWREAPYAPLPWPGEDARAVRFTAETPRLAGRTLYILPGVRGDADVMRGEETEILGLWTRGLLPPDGVVALPGTHAKHVTLRGGRIVDFRTYMTGELFALLGAHGSLADVLAGDGDGGDDGAFAAGVREGAARPLSAALFRVRAEALLGARPRGAAGRAFLSGVLLGAELAPLADRARAGTAVTFAAGTGLAPRYRDAWRLLAADADAAWLPAEAVDHAALHGQAAWLALRAAHAATVAR